MIEYKKGNIFAEDIEVLVNPVNCVGVMGRGLALQFKNRFPKNFKDYVVACKKGEVLPGCLFIFAVGKAANPHFIINFPTKRHWSQESKIEDIELGLKKLAIVIKKYDIHSIAIPPIGCGLGGLNWQDINLLIKKYLLKLKNVSIIVLEPEA